MLAILPPLPLPLPLPLTRPLLQELTHLSLIFTYPCLIHRYVDVPAYLPLLVFESWAPEPSEVLCCAALCRAVLCCFARCCL